MHIALLRRVAGFAEGRRIALSEAAGREGPGSGQPSLEEQLAAAREAGRQEAIMECAQQRAADRAMIARLEAENRENTNRPGCKTKRRMSFSDLLPTPSNAVPRHPHYHLSPPCLPSVSRTFRPYCKVRMKQMRPQALAS